MSVDLKVPEIGESIVEVIIGEWLKSEGDFVKRDEDVLVIETDKATVEIPAPESGKLERILKHSGDTAKIGEVIGRIQPAKQGISEAVETRAKTDEDSMTRPGVKKKTNGSPRDTEKTEQEIDDKGTKQRREPRFEASQTESARAVKEGSEKNWIQPPRRETSPQGGIDTEPGAVFEQQAAGWEEETPGDEVPQEPERNAAGDYFEAASMAQMERREPAKNRTQTPEAEERKDSAVSLRPDIISRKKTAGEDETYARDRSVDPGVFSRARPGRPREEQAVPMTPIRRRIAERLVKAQQETAFLTTFNEIDMAAVQKLRREFRDDFQKKFAAKLGYMSFFVKASVDALKIVPQVNAEIRGDDIVYRGFCDIGVAVGGGKGLVVPVLRNADQLSFAEIEQAIADFAARAEKNRLKPNDLEGGTFTISNGGVYGSLLSTPVINSPQSGILGMHAIQERPVVHNGEIVIRPMMYVALTYDHRIIDGREAVMFLKRIKECIEAPYRMLLEI